MRESSKTCWYLMVVMDMRALDARISYEVRGLLTDQETLRAVELSTSALISLTLTLSRLDWISVELHASLVDPAVCGCCCLVCMYSDRGDGSLEPCSLWARTIIT